MFPDMEAQTGGSFRLWEDKGAAMKKMLEDVGFQNIHMWQEPLNFPFKDGADYFEKMGKGNCAMAAKKYGGGDPGFADKLKAKMIEVWDKRSGNQTTEYRTFEIIVVTAIKE